MDRVAKLLDGRDEAFAERVQFKATAEFLTQLDGYIHHVQATNLRTKGIRIGMLTIDANWLSNQFSKRARFSVSEQINGVVNAIVELMKYQHQKEVVGKERARVRKRWNIPMSFR